MSKVLVTESNLESIATAIRTKKGVQTTYKPSQMAAAIESIETPNLEPLTANANGTYTPSSGKNGFSGATVNVPNSYNQSDEGKVVSGGALVAQTARASEITSNGTYDTTENNSVTVNVSGGGSSGVYVGTDAPSANIGTNGDYYYKRKLQSPYGYFTTPGSNSSTTQSGYEFTANTALTIIGLRGYTRSATSGSLVIAQSDGTEIARISNLSFAQGWNEALFDTPIQLTSGENYIVMIASNIQCLSYQSIHAASFNSSITGLRGRFGSLPGSIDYSNIYGADIIIQVDDPVYIVEEQYYKKSGTWELIQ